MLKRVLVIFTKDVNRKSALRHCVAQEGPIDLVI